MPPPAESGFVDVPAQATSLRLPGRIFYSFQPTQSTENKPKPLLIFFNGGPSFATSTCLLSYGTGPFTLDRPGTGDDSPHVNEHTFARFANLLYIDARNTGFSYNFHAANDASANDDVGDCREFMVEDAVDFLRVTFRFLTDHPDLHRSPVVLVGESYGGARAVTMAHLLFHYNDPSAPLPDDLRSDIRRYFDDFWEDATTPHAMSAIGRDFVQLVLIQPWFGAAQGVAQRPLIEHDLYLNMFPTNGNDSQNDVREKQEWDHRVDTRAIRALADTPTSHSLFGFDLAQARGILPEERLNALRINPRLDGNAELQFGNRFGSLRSGDVYFAPEGQFCMGATNSVTDSDEAIAWLPEVLRFSRLFITNARYDRNIHTPAIPGLLNDIGLPTEVDREPRPDVARPGWFRVNLTAAAIDPARNVEVRFPTYDDAGDTVTVKQGADLADDVAQWLAEPETIQPADVEETHVASSRGSKRNGFTAPAR